MRTALQFAAKAVAVSTALLIGYNMLTFAYVAAGHKMEYIPYLHFPIKLLHAAMG
ncbi:MAG: hypothetical protein JO019_05115 [Candidatus Kaiserbacteria bacterium]|nr:hypothetical protein [Candidatus Kaiserbacteria bacterium]